MPVDAYESDAGYECPTCSKELNTSLGLKQHHTKVHGESLVDTDECNWCGETFHVKPSQVGNYCSRECHGKWRTENGLPAKRRQVPLQCPECGEGFTTAQSNIEDGRRFCSRECYINSRSGKNVNCEVCGDGFYAYDTYVDDARFCSQDCYGVWLSENKSGENSWHWRGDERDTERPGYGAGWSEQKRGLVRDRDRRRCTECGMHEQQHVEGHGMKLHVHHEVNARESSNPAVYNAARNLRALCIGCHMSRH
jgi:hypothetical protein